MDKKDVLINELFSISTGNKFKVFCLLYNFEQKIVEYITLFRLQKGSDSKLELHLLVGFLTVSKLNISLKKGSEYDLFTDSSEQFAHIQYLI